MAHIFDFSIWDESIQQHPDQQKRIGSALSGKVVPISIDAEHQAGIFNGSGKEPYVTTLTACTCSDFTRRKLPCKHIYRLAFELGIVDTSNMSIEQVPYREIDNGLKSRAKKYIDTIGADNAEVFYDLFYTLPRKGYKIYTRSDLPEYIFDYGIFREIQDDRLKLSNLKKNELMALCAADVKPSSKKDIFINTILENKTDTAIEYCNSLVIVGISDEYKDIIEALKRHLLRVYPCIKQEFMWFE